MKASHWTDDELIASHYGVGPEDGHLQTCNDCQFRFSLLIGSRSAVDRQSDHGVTSQFLAAQRREIYNLLSTPRRLPILRWASATAAVAMVCGTMFIMKENRDVSQRQSAAYEAQLVEDVATVAQNSEPQAIAPMQGLFDGSY